MTTILHWNARTALTGGTAYQVQGTGLFHFTSAAAVVVASSDAEAGTYTDDFSVDAGAAKQIFLRSGMWIKPDVACYVQLVGEF